MEENEFYTLLARRYAENLLSEEEYEVFFHALQAGLLDHPLVAVLREEGAAPGDPLTETLARETAEVPLTTPVERQIPIRRLPRWTRAAGAAAVIALLAGGAWVWLSRPNDRQGAAIATAQKPIPPAGNKATLTLANGQTLVLDSAARGSLALQGNARVLKTDSNSLTYAATGSSAAVVYNTLATPRGGFYVLILPDGTHVWLNAASSITYPTAFTGNSRAVTVSGEVYFDVARDAARPFRVRIAATSPTSQSPEVEVLGTSFNITAYPDDPGPIPESEIRTTLIQGAVRVRQGENAVLLHPGQQARMTGDNQPIHLIPDADTAAAIAWITGYFQFRELSVPAVMRQISRWYDVNIVYDAPAASLTARHFGGRISRHKDLADLLPILKANQIHLRLDGSTIHVLP